LFDWDMRAAHQRRDPEGLQQAFQARCQAEQALDPMAGVDPDAAALYDELLADLGRRRRPAPEGERAAAGGRRDG
jgi:hypothetical protein